MARTKGAPARGAPRPVEICRVRDAFASFEGLVFTLAPAPCASASKCAAELAHMLEDARPSDVRLAGHGGGAPTLSLAPSMLAFANVLEGSSGDPRSGNPFYDEVRLFGNAAPRGSDVLHVPRLAPLLRSFSCNFLHFLAGTLPAAVALLGRVPQDTQFLIYGTAFAEALLTRAGLRSDRLLVYDPRCVYHADELYLVPGLNEEADLPAPETVAAVRRALGLAAGRAPGPPAVVLIERRGTERRLGNIDDVEEAMRAVASRCGVGFVRAVLEGMPVEDQLALSSRCGLLVGAEGAGLGHALCVPDGATVVNILPTRSRFGPLPSQSGYGYFHHLCSVRGTLRYRAVAVADADWDSRELRAPMRAVCAVLDEWADSHRTRR